MGSVLTVSTFRDDWTKTSNIRAIDFWTILCYIAVFYALIEYVAVLYLSKASANMKNLLDQRRVHPSKVTIVVSNLHSKPKMEVLKIFFIILTLFRSKTSIDITRKRNLWNTHLESFCPCTQSCSQLYLFCVAISLPDPIM